MNADLLRQSLDVTDLGRQAYKSTREFFGNHLSDLAIAQGGYCRITAPYLSSKVGHRLATVGLTNLMVFQEAHSVLINVSHLSGDVATFPHEYTVVGEDEVPSCLDLVIDANYKQFLPKEVTSPMPDVFLGTRDEAMALMHSTAKDRWAYQLFELVTLKERAAVTMRT